MSTRKKQIKVSVIMPVFNAGMFLSQAIDSICAQTFGDWELILVDDGSIDNSRSIIKHYAAADSRIIPLFKEHEGIASALNSGIQASEAPFVVRMDADDCAHPERIQLQHEFLMAHPEIGVIATQVEVFPKSEKGEGLKAYVQWSNTLLGYESIEQMRFVDAPVIHPSVCFRRSLLEQYGAYREGDFPEDYELWLRWMAHGVRFAKLPQCLLKWRDHENKLTRTDSRYREQALWTCKGDYFDRWFRSHVDSSRSVWVWGAGRRTRSRLRYFSCLQGTGTITAYIDIDPRKIGQKINGATVVDPECISYEDNAFIIVMVGSRGARAQILEFLHSKGKHAGIDFIMVA